MVTVEDLAELGSHWQKAGEPDRAAPCYVAAARRATEAWALAEAGRLYRTYLELIATPTLESIKARIELGEKVLAAFEAKDEEAK